jgi:putative mRNA 3-end processing factor
MSVTGFTSTSWDNNMVKIGFMGGTREVGRNAILLKSEEAQVLLDYGVKIGTPPDFPSHVRAREIDGIVIAHAHLDHSGGAPIFYLSESKPFFATPMTTELIQILIQDMIKLNSYYLPYEHLELNNMIKQRKDLNYGQEVKIKDISFQLKNAGHIPGSAMVDVKIQDKSILYTSDFNTTNTRLCNAAKIPRKRYDAVIIESTYATHTHPDRKELESEFVRDIKSTINNGGKVLVPAFAVGRSHEILSVLHANKFEGKIILDGMARAVNQIMLEHPEAVKTPKTYAKAVGNVHIVKGWRDRRQSFRNANVIVAPSGMLQGGTALFYMEKLALYNQNSVNLVSFQVPGTGGAKLLETGKFVIRNVEQNIEAKVKHYDFSSHCGKEALQDFLRGLKGKPEIFIVHGEPENCEFLAHFVQDELDLKAEVPEEGEQFTI